MVSPSKKKKADKKGRETQSQTPLSNVNQADSTKKPTCKLSSRKPLATKKVYLDVRSAAVLTKLEKDLKQLGAKVEPFLDTDIDYFVTDRPSTTKSNLNPGQPTTPSPLVAVVGGPSPSPSLLTAGSTPSAVPSPSPGGGGGGGNVVLRGGQGGSSSHHHVTRSRAEAMLDCVRAPLLANDVTTLLNTSHQHTTVDPIENARAHNVPVYQVQQFVRWVEKLVERTREGSSSGGAARRVKVLNKEFLKLECARRRPEFRELKVWPALRYEGTPGGPFETRGGGGGQRQAAGGKKQQPQRQNNAAGAANLQHQQQQQRSSRRAADRMTRKETAVSGGGVAGGYCEMCCLDYGDLSQHLTSAGHLKLAQDPAQFAALDSLIRDACLDTLLSNGTTTNATVTNHCGVVLSPLNVSGYTNNNNNNNRRVLRSARASVASQNGVAAACAGMGNRTSSSSTNGHHNTRSSQHRTAANINAKAMPPQSPNEVSITSPPPPAAAAPSIVANGIINHNHLTRLSVRTDLAAAIGGGVGLATPTLATPPSAQPTNDSEVARTRQQSGGGGTSSRSSTCGESASAATCGQHLLRSKKQLRLPHALQGTTAEGPGEGGTSPLLLKRRRCKMRRRRKRLSVEEKLIEDNRSYYKVEVLNSKLRSTGYYMSQRELELNRTTTTTASNRGGSGEQHSVANSVAAAAAASVANSTTAATNSCSMSPPLPQDAAAVGTPEKQPVVMRFKKVRKSELSLLSDEAENFMFGDTSRHHHHHLRSSDHDDDDDEYGADEEEVGDEEDNTTSSRSQSGGGGAAAAPLAAAADESSQSSSFGASQRRKRRTHAELFINDNLDYYKFDLLPGSRLRHVKVEGESPGKKREEGGLMAVKIKEEIKEETQTDEEEGEGEEEEYGGKEQLTADEVTFAFESAPIHESWYQTYRRQDEAREQHMQAYHSYPVLRLPYEYRDKQKRRLLAQAAASGGKAFAFKRRKKRGALSSVLGKRGVSALDDKPRKSPRCHASTLAILSTLKYRRRRISPQLMATQLQSPPAAAAAAAATAPTLSAASPMLVMPTKSAVVDDGPLSRPTLPEDSVKVGRRRRAMAASEDFVALADRLDNYFCEFYFENGGDVEDSYASTMQKLRDAWVECHSGGSTVVGEEEDAEAKKEESLSPSTSKRLSKPKHSPSTSSTDYEPQQTYCSCTRDVDPSIFDDYSWLWGDFAAPGGDSAPRVGDFAPQGGGLFAPGPQEVDFLQLLAGYRQCNSMERALYGGHTINPKAVDSLRRNVMTSSSVVGATADSCASSECGGSSTGELLGFTEDGRMLSSKRRKRKKRNMTGWPKDKPKKLLTQQQLKMATTSTATTGGCSRSLQKVTEEEGEEEAETSLVLKVRRPKDDVATADDDNSSCDVKVRRCRVLSTTAKDDATVDDDNSSGDVKVRRCRVLSTTAKDDATVDDDNSSGDVKVRRCRVLSTTAKDDATVDDDNSSGDVKVRRCRVLSTTAKDDATVDDDNSSCDVGGKVRRCRGLSVSSEVDDSSCGDVVTRSTGCNSGRHVRGALRRRAASMTSATAGRRGRGRGRGRGGWVRR